MKYNAKYDVYVSKDGIVCKYKHDKLVCRAASNQNGYRKVHEGLVHRVVWETFNGEIPAGYEIDHINDVRDDNRLCNLRLITHLDNVRKACLGKVFTDEHKQRIGDAHRGIKHAGMAEANKRIHTGRHWFNNGTINVQTYECPEGFVKGRVKCHV